MVFQPMHLSEQWNVYGWANGVDIKYYAIIYTGLGYGYIYTGALGWGITHIAQQNVYIRIWSWWESQGLCSTTH